MLCLTYCLLFCCYNHEKLSPMHPNNHKYAMWVWSLRKGGHGLKSTAPQLLTSSYASVNWQLRQWWRLVKVQVTNAFRYTCLRWIQRLPPITDMSAKQYCIVCYCCMGFSYHCPNQQSPLFTTGASYFSHRGLYSHSCHTAMLANHARGCHISLMTWSMRWQGYTTTYSKLVPLWISPTRCL